ncbi:MAG: DNA alkylation repair protein, partial [Candidatus Obscuribacterales bacterium]|nr:DNA alkylation repair protein [Candidatus Obscuribacterales bacterium]
KNLIKLLETELQRLSDPKKAVEMAAYMKTDMPFYGVQKPDRLPLLKVMKNSFRPASASEYRDTVLLLWQQPHREEKYLAINYAELFEEHVCLESMDLYEQMIREGAWWDFVDAISINLVGHVYLKERKALKSLMNKWNKDKDMWIRRSSLLVHIHHKKETDEEQLFEHCLRLAHEKEFFIRKAIGWALREHSKTNPRAVKKFLKDKRDLLSNLSYREAAKHLIKVGLIKD